MPVHRGHIAILTLCNCYRCSYTGNLDTSVSGRFTERFLHLFFRFIRHIDQSEPIEHSVDVSHSPDIAQSFRSFNYFSYLFNIAQRQQYRTPRQAFTVFPSVDSQFLCVLPIPALSYFIGKGQPRVRFETHTSIKKNHLPQMLFCRLGSQFSYRSVSPLPLCSYADFLFICCAWETNY